MGLDVFDRVVAGVGVEGIDPIHTVFAVAAAVAALGDIHIDPVVFVEGTAVGGDFDIANAAADVVGSHLGQGFHQGVGDDVAGAAAGNHWRGIDRVGQTALGGGDVNRPRQARVLGHVFHQGGV